MKTVFLVRHAKSSWDYSSLRDSERPLNDQGLKDAPKMARVLKKEKVSPDAIISSPAVRALTTAIFFKNELNVDGEDIIIKNEIYEAAPVTIVKMIQRLPESYQTVLIFGHNPTFTEVANLFTDDFIPNVPTCGVVKIEAGISNWTEFGPGKGSVESFIYPKLF